MTAAEAFLHGKRILVVEDDYFIAQVVIELLHDAGAEVIGPLGWVDEAVAFITNNSSTFDGAVLDVDLHGFKSYPVADALASNNICFVFATGYGEGSLESEYQHFPRCQKPFDQEVLVAALGGRLQNDYGVSE